jgi:hypothetical protein
MLTGNTHPRLNIFSYTDEKNLLIAIDRFLAGIEPV